MDLTFVQTSNMFGRDGAWETEFSVDQEFNLHLERESSGKIIMMQKTAGTFFDIVKDFDMKSGDVVYDYDSASFLGTKTIKIVSESAIRFASLTTSGEVTEIKSQSKEIEVTSNGTTEVTPDAGFAYLNSVKVKTNVPTSGEGGGSASSVEYLDLRGLDAETKQIAKDISFLGKKERYIFPIPLVTSFGSDSGEIECVAVDWGTKCGTYEIEGYLTLAEFIEIMGVMPMLNSIPRITEEEFYTL